MADDKNFFPKSAQDLTSLPNSLNTSDNNTTSDSNQKDFVINESSIKNQFSAPDLVQVTAKIDSIKKWTRNTYKTTKQSINEHLGKGKKTVDKDLEERIDALRELQRRYREVIASTRGYAKNFILTNNLQNKMAEAVYQLSCKEDVLNNEFALHSEVLRSMSQNGEIYIQTLNAYISALETLTNKTIQDTLLTIDYHDQARLEFDVYRNELENLRLNQNPQVVEKTLAETEKMCNEHKLKYEQLKEDVRVKITLLEENRCKVMKEQTNSIQKSLLVYLSDNTNTLKDVVDKLNSFNTVYSNLYENDPMKPSVTLQNF